MGRNKNILYTSIWLASVTITWLIASKYYTPNTSSIDEKAELAAEHITKDKYKKKVSTAEPDSLSSKDSNRRINVKSTHKNIDIKEFLSSLSDQMDFEDDLFIIRNVRLMTLFLEDCNEGELLAILKNTQANKNENWNILHLLAFSKLADLEPEKAIRLSEELEFEKDMLRPEFIESWSKKSPLEALAFLNQQIDSKPPSYAIVFKNLARNSYPQALFELSKIDINNQKFAFEGIARTLSSPDEFKDLLSYTQEGENGQKYKIINQWAIKSPIDALQWAEVQEEKEVLNYKDQITKQWLSKDPEIAAGWLLENNSNNPETFEQIVSYWNDDQTENLIQFLEEQPYSSGLDNAYLKVIENNYSLDNLDILQKIKSPELRREAAKTVYQKMIANESPMASEFLKNTKDLTQEEKEELILSTQPAEALNLIEED